MNKTNRKLGTLAVLVLAAAGTGAALGQPSHTGTATGHWDPSFGADALNGTVYALDVYDGELYAAGSFTDAAGTAVSSIARWDGTQWRDVGGGVHDGAAAGTIWDLAVYDDGSGPQLYAVGDFDQAGTVGVLAAARWDGTAWSDAGAGYPSDISYLTDLGVIQGQEAPGLYSGGVTFDAGCGGTVYRWDAGSSSWQFVVTTYPDITGLDSADDGSGETIFVGGPYFGCGGTPIYDGSMKWDNGWQGLGSIFQPERFLEYDGKIYACGVTVYDASTDDWYGPVETWDGVSWEQIATYAYGSPADGHDLEVFNDCARDQLFVGGAGLTPAGLTPGAIFKLRGTTWVALGTGIPNGSVRALQVYQGALYVAGQFSVAGGHAVENVARWDTCH